MGLPGAGKTTLARIVSRKLGAVLFNADEVRENINKDLGFSVDDRIEQARRMGWLCNRVVDAGGIAIADFVCPTPETREAFGEAFVIWVDRIQEGRFHDTNELFVPPDTYHIRIPFGEPAEQMAEEVSAAWKGVEATGQSGLHGKLSRCLEAISAMPMASRDKTWVETRPIAYLLLCMVVFGLRSAVDSSPFSALNSFLLISLLGATMMCRGTPAAILTSLIVIGFEFFLIDPVFTFGVHDWWAMLQLAAGSIVAACLGVAAGYLVHEKSPKSFG